MVERGEAVAARTPSANPVHFGMMLGSPPGEPGGGIIGVKPPPLGRAEMPGSTSGGGQITPLDRDNSSLKLALPVVSPGGTAKPPVLAWQPKFGVDEIGGGASRSGCCADAFVTAAHHRGRHDHPRSHGYLLTLSSRKRRARRVVPRLAYRGLSAASQRPSTAEPKLCPRVYQHAYNLIEACKWLPPRRNTGITLPPVCDFQRP